MSPKNIALLPVDPATCKSYAGDAVPIPSLLFVLSQYRFAFYDNVDVPLQKATLVLVPEPPTLLLNVFQSVEVK